MSWEITTAASVAGRVTGSIPAYDYNEQYPGTWYDTAASGAPFTGVCKGSTRSLLGSIIDPVSAYGNGWNPTADIYPTQVFTLKGTDGEVNSYVRMYVDSVGGSYTITAQVATDLGGPWIDLGAIAATIVNPSWAACMRRYVDGYTYLGLSYMGKQTYGGDDHWSLIELYLNLEELADNIGVIYGEEEISPEYGEASGPGGYDGGTFDDSSDIIGVPTMPTIGVSSIGFVNVYNPSSGALTQLGEELFPDFTPISPYTPTGNTVIDAITDVAEALANIASNIPNVIAMYANAQLINYIIDCHIIPVTPTVGSSQAIKIGYRTMSQYAPKVSSDYVDCDCGVLSIGEYYRNFIDYGPYTQAKLFLPFVGFVPIEPELFQSGTLQVIYRFNVIDGSFMAFVLSTSSKSKLTTTVIGQWGGNACVHVPITGINYSNMVSGIAAGASAVVAELGKGSLSGMADAALNTATAAPALQSSNGYNATTSFLSVRTPYLMIERSVSHYSKDYGHEQGYPSEITANWNTLSGYTESDSIHLEGLGATKEEMNEILNPSLYIGRCPDQVDKFLEEIKPLIANINKADSEINV